jgi:hypothetical protein
LSAQALQRCGEDTRMESGIRMREAHVMSMHAVLPPRRRRGGVSKRSQMVRDVILPQSATDIGSSQRNEPDSMRPLAAHDYIVGIEAPSIAGQPPTISRLPPSRCSAQMVRIILRAQFLAGTSASA